MILKDSKTFSAYVRSKLHSGYIKQAYLRNVYSKFGGSEKILSNNGTEF